METEKHPQSAGIEKIRNHTLQMRYAGSGRVSPGISGSVSRVGFWSLCGCSSWLICLEACEECFFECGYCGAWEAVSSADDAELAHESAVFGSEPGLVGKAVLADEPDADLCVDHLDDGFD